MSTGLEEIKAEKDYSKEADALVVEARKIAKTNLNEALEKLLGLEKQTRQSSDLYSTQELLVEIITLCKNAGEWELMNEQVTMLSKKHGQLKQAIIKMIELVISFLDEVPNIKTKIDTIENIRSVTEGKIFVEVERARVTKELSKIYEEKGDITKAANLLCELQVETYGSMDNKEKTEFILEQMRLCVEKGDFQQGLVLSRKISVRYFNKAIKSVEDKDLVDQRLRYFELMIKIDLNDSKYLNVCKHYLAVYQTKAVADDSNKWKPILENIVYFIILSPYDNEQSDLMYRIAQDKNLSHLPLQFELIKCFTAKELMRWPQIEKIYGKHLCSTTVFSSNSKPESFTNNIPLILKNKVASSEQRWHDLHRRVIEHNIRVISMYYTRIRLPRLVTLLDLTEQEAETYLSDLVVKGVVYARINRPLHIVNFSPPASPNDILNEWSHNIYKLLENVETLEHLITKEEMVHAL